MMFVEVYHRQLVKAVYLAIVNTDLTLSFFTEASFQVFFCFLWPVLGRGRLDQP